MNPSQWFLAGLLLTAAGGLAALFVRDKWKSRLYFVFSFAAAVPLIVSAVSVFLSGTAAASFDLGYPAGRVPFVMDALAALFVVLIALGNVLAALNGTGYLKPYEGSDKGLGAYHFNLGLMTVSMLLVVTLQNALAFLIVWELMSLSSFFLAAFDKEKAESRSAALYYFTAMQVGLAFLLTAFSVLSAKCGSFLFDDFRALTASGGASLNWVLVLFLLGFGTKAGFVPLHTWLPKAHPAAPAPVSAFMSGVMIKTGIYGILRMLGIFHGAGIGIAYGILAVSLLTAFFGILYALKQTDVKRLLAYSSIENIGIIGTGIGLGLVGYHTGNPFVALAGFAGAFLHIAAHFFMKTLLFFGSGSVYLRAHTRNMEELGGLAKSMPGTAALFLTGSLAISALPPFCGFAGEFLLYYGSVTALAAPDKTLPVAAVAVMTVLSLVGILALSSFVKAYSVIFSGTPRTRLHSDPAEAPASMLASAAVPALFTVLLGFGAFLLVKPAVQIASNVLPQAFAPETSASLAASLANLGKAFGLLSAVFLGALGLRAVLLRGKKVERFKTWDCGFRGGDGKVQYTATSFSLPTLSVFSPLYGVHHVDKNREKLLSERSTNDRNRDIFENGIIRPAGARLKKFFNLFSWVQSGNTQQYILYGILFLAAILVSIIGAKK